MGLSESLRKYFGSGSVVDVRTVEAYQVGYRDGFDAGAATGGKLAAPVATSIREWLLDANFSQCEVGDAVRYCVEADMSRHVIERITLTEVVLRKSRNEWRSMDWDEFARTCIKVPSCDPVR